MNSEGGKVAGALLFLGGAQFSVGLIVAEAVYPNYSVSQNYISDLGVWGHPSAAVFNPAIFLFGLLIMAGAYLIQREFKARYVALFFMLAGLGSAGVGAFPENTFLVNGTPVFHSIFALMAFLFGGAATIASHKLAKPPFRHFAIVFGAITLLALGLFLTTTSSGSLGLGVGGLERMVAYPTIIWTIGLGGYLMTQPKEGLPT
jgi:hypothetical membrane protein